MVNNSNVIPNDSGSSMPFTQITTTAASKPTIAVGSGAGSGATATVANGSTDIKGNITITTGGSGTGASTFATVTFNVAYSTAPEVVIMAGNNKAAGAGATKIEFFITTSTTGFVLQSANAGSVSTDYTYRYLVIG